MCRHVWLDVDFHPLELHFPLRVHQRTTQSQLQPALTLVLQPVLALVPVLMPLQAAARQCYTGTATWLSGLTNHLPDWDPGALASTPRPMTTYYRTCMLHRIGGTGMWMSSKMSAIVSCLILCWCKQPSYISNLAPRLGVCKASLSSYCNDTCLEHVFQTQFCNS